MSEELTETEEIVLYTNVAYAGKGRRAMRSTHYPSIIGLDAVNIENLGVFGFNTAWVDPVTGRGSVYANSNVNTKFWQISLDPTIWKIVDVVPMLLNVSASGTVTDKDSWAGEVGDTYNTVITNCQTAVSRGRLQPFRLRTWRTQGRRLHSVIVSLQTVVIAVI